MVERKHGKTKRLARKFQLSARLYSIYILYVFFIYIYIYIFSSSVYFIIIFLLVADSLC